MYSGNESKPRRSGRSRRRRICRYPPKSHNPATRFVADDSEPATSQTGTRSCPTPDSLCPPNSPSSVLSNALYVDIVKKLGKKRPTIEFTINKEDFPALPGTEDLDHIESESSIADDDTLRSIECSSIEEAINYDGDVEHDDDGSSLSDLGAVGGFGQYKTPLRSSNYKLAVNSNWQRHNHSSETSFVNSMHTVSSSLDNMPATSTPVVQKAFGRGGNAAPAIQSMSLEAEELEARFAALLTSRRPATRSNTLLPNLCPSVLSNKFGMLGLANTIRKLNSDKSEGVGVDPNKLGLEFLTGQKIHPAFAGPFANYRCNPHEIFANVPYEYLLNGRVCLHPPKTSQMKVELLFYFFYLYSHDMMQLLAAAELAERGWRFHLEHKVWLRRQDDYPNYIFYGRCECGIFNYFSYNRWKVCEHYFELDIRKIERTATKRELYQLYGDHPQMGYFDGKND